MMAGAYISWARGFKAIPWLGPFTVVHNSSEEQSMLNEGYAIVGVLEDTTGALIFLGQR